MPTTQHRQQSTDSVEKPATEIEAGTSLGTVWRARPGYAGAGVAGNDRSSESGLRDYCKTEFFNTIDQSLPLGDWHRNVSSRGERSFANTRVSCRQRASFRSLKGSLVIPKTSCP